MIHIQPNTPEAMRKAVKLRLKYGSWEEVERRTNALRHTVEAMIGLPIDAPMPSDNAAGE